MDSFTLVQSKSSKKRSLKKEQKKYETEQQKIRLEKIRKLENKLRFIKNHIAYLGNEEYSELDVLVSELIRRIMDHLAFQDY
jgi:hypothetical protein